MSPKQLGWHSIFVVALLTAPLMGLAQEGRRGNRGDIQVTEILRETPSFRAGRKGGGPCGATAEPSGGVEAPAFRPGRTSTDFPHRDHGDRHPLWARFERAERFEHSRDVQAHGLSQRQAAKRLQVPRSTLQAWHAWHDTLDSCPHVAQFFQSGPGLAFLHRLVLALHLVCVEVGACGIRLVCLFLTLTGLDRFVAASYGAQQHVNYQVEHAIVNSRHSETARLAKAMPHTDLPVAQDETRTAGL